MRVWNGANGREEVAYPARAALPTPRPAFPPPQPKAGDAKRVAPGAAITKFFDRRPAKPARRGGGGVGVLCGQTACGTQQRCHRKHV